jgi:hypothetical protein
MFDPIWVCKDGRRMKVSEMEMSHLLNAIAKIERSRRWRKEWLPRLHLEVTIRTLPMNPSK